MLSKAEATPTNFMTHAGGMYKGMRLEFRTWTPSRPRRTKDHPRYQTERNTFYRLLSMVLSFQVSNHVLSIWNKKSYLILLGDRSRNEVSDVDSCYLASISVRLEKDKNPGALHFGSRWAWRRRARDNGRLGAVCAIVSWSCRSRDSELRFSSRLWRSFGDDDSMAIAHECGSGLGGGFHFDCVAKLNMRTGLWFWRLCLSRVRGLRSGS